MCSPRAMKERGGWKNPKENLFSNWTRNNCNYMAFGSFSSVFNAVFVLRYCRLLYSWTCSFYFMFASGIHLQSFEEKKFKFTAHFNCYTLFIPKNVSRQNFTSPGKKGIFILQALRQPISVCSFCEWNGKWTQSYNNTVRIDKVFDIGERSTWSTLIC